MISHDAADLLFELYAESSSIRRMLQRAHVALTITVNNEHGQVRAEHVLAAAPRL